VFHGRRAFVSLLTVVDPVIELGLAASAQSKLTGHGELVPAPAFTHVLGVARAPQSFDTDEYLLGVKRTSIGTGMDFRHRQI